MKDLKKLKSLKSLEMKNKMEVKIYLKGKKEPLIYKGDRIDVLDFEMDNVKYKQVRYFKKGFSKSELIEVAMITKIQEN
jgi:hypothetical protein